jgi:hypothetical protein
MWKEAGARQGKTTNSPVSKAGLEQTLYHGPAKYEKAVEPTVPRRTVWDRKQKNSVSNSIYTSAQCCGSVTDWHKGPLKTVEVLRENVTNKPSKIHNLDLH